MYRIKRNFSSIISKGFLQIVLSLWAVGQIFPLIWMFYSSLKTRSEIEQNIWKLPSKLHFENYTDILLHKTSSAVRNITVEIYYKNTFIITIISICILILVSMLAAYAIAKLRVPGKNIILFLLVGSLAIPIHSYFIPLYYFIADMKLLNRYLGLIMPYVAFNAPFSIALLQSYFRSFPNELIESAKVEGCSDIGVFFRIVMPLSKGAISSVAIINFINIWNEFLISLVIMKRNVSRTLPVGLTLFRGDYVTEFNYMFAALTLSVLPLLIFYFFFHRNIMSGMWAGAIKE